MRLSKEACADYAQLIKNACGHLPSVFENGVFEFFGLDEASKNRVLNDLKTALFVDDIYARADRQHADKYHLTGMLVEKLVETYLDENVEIHDTLNPNIWSDTNELLPEIEKKIQAIVNIFVEQLKEDEIDLIVDDIYLVGSNANYNYTPESDLDIHIIADETTDCSSEHLPLIYNAYKRLFNNNYDITLNGVNAEIYVENKDKISNVSSGVYSLNNGWIKKPTISDIPKIDESKLEKLIQEYEDKYLDIEDNPSIEAIETFIDDIYEIRTNSIAKDGEFGIGNLMFKEIRRLGYLDNLKDLKNKLISKELSLT